MGYSFGTPGIFFQESWAMVPKFPDFQVPRFPDASAGAAGRILRFQLDPSPNAPKDQIRRKDPCCDCSVRQSAAVPLSHFTILKSARKANMPAKTARLSCPQRACQTFCLNLLEIMTCAAAAPIISVSSVVDTDKLRTLSTD